MASPQLGIVWPLWFILFVGWVLILRQALDRGRRGLGRRWQWQWRRRRRRCPPGCCCPLAPPSPLKAAHTSSPCSCPTSPQRPVSAASGERICCLAANMLPSCRPPLHPATAAVYYRLLGASAPSLSTASFAQIHLQNCGSSGINLVGVGVAYLPNTGCGLFYRFTWWTCW